MHSTTRTVIEISPSAAVLVFITTMNNPITNTKPVTRTHRAHVHGFSLALISIVVITMTILVAGCGDDNQSMPSGPLSVTAQPPPLETPASGAVVLSPQPMLTAQATMTTTTSPAAGKEATQAPAPRPAVILQLQYRSTVNYGSTQLFDPDGKGVRTGDAVIALEALYRLHETQIPGQVRKAAEVALLSAQNWLRNRPPNGVPRGNYTYPFGPGYRFDILVIKDNQFREP